MALFLPSRCLYAANGLHLTQTISTTYCTGLSCLNTASLAKDGAVVAGGYGSGEARVESGVVARGGRTE
jgi:hypothetical protein